MYKAKQLIVMRRDLKMRKGKIAAQAGHACVTAVLMALEKEGRLGEVHAEDGGIRLTPSDKAPTPLSEWFGRGVAKICVYVDSEEATWLPAAITCCLSAKKRPSSTCLREERRTFSC